jgi:hypothetical protein
MAKPNDLVLIYACLANYSIWIDPRPWRNFTEPIGRMAQWSDETRKSEKVLYISLSLHRSEGQLSRQTVIMKSRGKAMDRRNISIALILQNRNMNCMVVDQSPHSRNRQTCPCYYCRRELQLCSHAMLTRDELKFLGYLWYFMRTNDLHSSWTLAAKRHATCSTSLLPLYI